MAFQKLKMQILSAQGMMSYLLFVFSSKLFETASRAQKKLGNYKGNSLSYKGIPWVLGPKNNNPTP